jgi:FdhE protein
MTGVWDRRLRRAEVLEGRWPYAREVLAFFRSVTTLQAEIYRRLDRDKVADPRKKRAEAGEMAPFAGRVIDLFVDGGPRELAAGARRTRDEWGAAEHRLAMYGGDSRFADGYGPGDEVERVLWEPYMILASEKAGPLERRSIELAHLCPLCDAAPLASIFREDRSAETVRRSLLCVLCSSEWEVARVLCPRCKEEDPARLPRFTADEIPWIRVDACDSCMSYIKTIDLTKEPDAEPVVDELASMPLDIIARERGYTKIATNLAGL